MSRFDTIIISFLSTVAVLIGAVIWRGDQLGIGVLTTFPESRAASTQTQIRIAFDAPIAFAEDVTVSLDPPAEGAFTIQNNLLIFQAETPLTSNTTYAVTVDGDLRNDQGRRLKEPVQWQFTTGEPRILFISWEPESLNQIYEAPISGEGEAKPLSTVEGDVTDFAVSPDGALILFTVFRAEDGGSDLWKMDADGSNQAMFLPCENAACSQMVWVPNSNRVIYERRTIPNPGAPPGLPRLWWLDIITNETVPVFQDSQLLGLGATISENGDWFSFVSPTDQGIQVYSLVDGAGIFIPNRMGSPAAWNPETGRLLLNDIQFLEENDWQVHLLEVDVNTEDVVTLSNDTFFAVDDSTPTFSPNGRFIAFGRKEARTAMGRQLWIMNSDGTDAYAVTNDPDVHYGPFEWSPNGRFIIMQQYQLKEQFASPQLMIHDFETGEWREVRTPAIQPFAFIP
ncbi:MAG: Ig-like domain-containing protein [Chloroflexota bacterium]